ncbi:MAG: hypothetical protein OJF49_000444 [Ktedonobacterales bacterium]|jgi:hypothetical protein|nr:MAG: hypothetical protein OJF49_000444 [Ktedonobacterales bacterium]
MSLAPHTRQPIIRPHPVRHGRGYQAQRARAQPLRKHISASGSRPPRALNFRSHRPLPVQPKRNFGKIGNYHFSHIGHEPRKSAESATPGNPQVQDYLWSSGQEFGLPPNVTSVFDQEIGHFGHSNLRRKISLISAQVLSFAPTYSLPRPFRPLPMCENRQNRQLSHREIGHFGHRTRACNPKLRRKRRKIPRHLSPHPVTYGHNRRCIGHFGHCVQSGIHTHSSLPRP